MAFLGTGDGVLMKGNNQEVPGVKIRTINLKGEKNISAMEGAKLSWVIKKSGQ